jgi:hypothetical protein
VRPNLFLVASKGKKRTGRNCTGKAGLAQMVLHLSLFSGIQLRKWNEPAMPHLGMNTNCNQLSKKYIHLGSVRVSGGLSLPEIAVKNREAEELIIQMYIIIYGRGYPAKNYPHRIIRSDSINHNLGMANSFECSICFLCLDSRVWHGLNTLSDNKSGIPFFTGKLNPILPSLHFGSGMNYIQEALQIS